MMESAEMFASNIFKSAFDLIMSVSWIAITVVVLVAAVTYFFRRYTIMCIGRKIRLDAICADSLFHIRVAYAA